VIDDGSSIQTMDSGSVGRVYYVGLAIGFCWTRNSGRNDPEYESRRPPLFPEYPSSLVVSIPEKTAGTCRW
jgi:hypothetical protein